MTTRRLFAQKKIIEECDKIEVISPHITYPITETDNTSPQVFAFDINGLARKRDSDTFGVQDVDYTNTGNIKSLSITGTTLFAHGATGTTPGAVSLIDQTMGDGNKTFQDDVITLKRFRLPDTASATEGVIDFEGPANKKLRLHNYSAGAISRNVYLGDTSGNFTSDPNATDNIGIGANTLSAVTTAARSIAIGSNALQNITNTDANIAIGNNSLKTTVTGFENIGIGENTLTNATTAGFCTAIGTNSQAANLIGQHNVTINTGENLTGNDNIMIKGGNELTNAERMIVIGRNAALVATDNSKNSVLIGVDAGQSRTVFEYDIIIGDYAGANYATGSANTMIGESIAEQGENINSCTLLGQQAAAETATLTRVISIGAASNPKTDNATDVIMIGGEGSDLPFAATRTREIYLGDTANTDYRTQIAGILNPTTPTGTLVGPMVVYDDRQNASLNYWPAGLTDTPLTNVMSFSLGHQYNVALNSTGISLNWNLLNGALKDTTVGGIDTWSTQLDQAYYTISNDNNVLTVPTSIQFLQPAWYTIHAVMVLGGTGGTQNLSFGIRDYISGVSQDIPLCCTAMIQENTSNGVAMNASGTFYFDSTHKIEFQLSTSQAVQAMWTSAGGLMARPYISITRLNNAF
jgi:hypothetical protein